MEEQRKNIRKGSFTPTSVRMERFIGMFTATPARKESGFKPDLKGDRASGIREENDRKR